MSSPDRSTVDPRTPRPQHRHSKSAATVPTQGGQQQNHNHQRNGRRAQERKQPTPAWQDSAPSSDAFGDFDPDGNFISAPVIDRQEGSDSPAEKGVQRQAQKGRRKRAMKEAIQPAAMQTHPNGTAVHPQTKDMQSQPANPAQTPVKSTAYAGPTFHASPAASALPLPRFFSKSVPADTAPQGMQARLEQEKEISDKSESPEQEEVVPAKVYPPQALGAEVPRPSDSPLDLFFKADRAEKASSMSPFITFTLKTDRHLKARSGSTAPTITPPSNPPPRVPQTEPPPANYWARIYGADQSRHGRQKSNTSGKEMFMMELDGNSAPSVSLTPPLPDQAGLSKAATVPHQASARVSSQQPFDQSIYTSPNYGRSMPSLPDPTVNTPQAATPYAQQQQPQTPRSAGSTPIPQNYSPYHYGNKNLSPLFQAARNESGRRSSSLRQEVRPESSNELPGNQPSQHSSARPTPPGAPTDASSVARDYLRSHLNQGQAMFFNSNDNMGQPAAPSILRTASDPYVGMMAGASHAAGYDSPSPRQPVDVKSMEDDLRRLLNLNIRGGTGN
jgi:hypothetical protein